MKRRWAVGLMLVGAAVGLGALLRPGPPPATPRPEAAPAVSSLPLPAPAAEPASAAALPVAASASEPVRPATAAEATPPPAHWSMADARERGDERAPPLQRAPGPQPVSAWELSDHDAYARREADLRARARADYVRATDAYLPELADGIARGRAAGVPPEAVAKMEAKLKRLQALRDELARPAAN